MQDKARNVLKMIKETWDGIPLSRARDLVAPPIAWTPERVNETISSLLRDIKIKPEWEILELGCGLGRLLKKLSLSYPNIFYGIDISEDILRFATETLTDHKNVILKVNNGYEIPFEDASIDFCFSVCVFQHIGSKEVQQSYISEAHRVLKEGGFFKLQHLQGSGQEGVSGFLGYAPPSSRDFEDLLCSSFQEVKISTEQVRDHLWYWATCIK